MTPRKEKKTNIKYHGSTPYIYPSLNLTLFLLQSPSHSAHARIGIVITRSDRHFGLVDIGQRWPEGKTRAKMGKHGGFKSLVVIVLLCDCTIISTVTQ